MNKNTTVFSHTQRLFVIIVAFALGFALVACGGSQEKKDQPAEATAAEEETKGKLTHTYTIVDEQGRKSGTLTLDFHGGAVIRDEKGDIIGKFSSEKLSEETKQPAEATAEEAEQPAEATEVKPSEEPAKEQPAN